MRQSFKTVDVLRLDLERPPATGELVSLVENPDGELGGWGWITPAGAVAGGTVGGQRRLWYFTGATGRMEAETKRVTPGHWLRASWVLPAIGRPAYYRVHVEFRDAAGGVISSSLLHSGQPSTSRIFSSAVQVKPGSHSARLIFSFAASADMATPLPSGTRVDLTGVKWAAAPTSAALAGIADAQPVYYVDVLGPTHDIGIERDGFNVATLSATIIDATLDPSQSDIVRPGRRVRLVVDDSGEVLFTGKTLTAKVSYDLTRSDANERARIALSAVDPFTEPAKAKRADGVRTINELSAVLEGAGVPWDVNGYSGQYAGANIVAHHPEASAVDQVAITRDSNLGYAWVSRRGVLTVRDRSQMTTTPAATLDETVYNGDLVIDYDPDQVMNTLTVKALVVDAWDDTVEVEFGPFVDQDSVDEWGPQSAEFTVQGIPATQDDEGNWSSAPIATLAAMILINTGQPERRVQSLTVPIATTAALPHALRDLYDLVRVVNERADIDQNLRVTGIKHAITPEKWLMTLTFNGDGVVGQPSQVPSVPVSTTAVKEEVDKTKAQAGSLADDLDHLNGTILPQVQQDLADLNGDLAGLQGVFPITETNIANGAITTPKMTANSINGDRIIANTLHADKIVGNSITGDKIQGNTISGDKIIANTISGDKIVANSIGVDRLSANVFSAITITANQITGRISTDRLETNANGAISFGSPVVLQGATVSGALLVEAGGIRTSGEVYGGGDVGSGGRVYGAVVSGGSVWTTSPPEVSATANAFIGANGQICKSTSSRRRKTDIEDLGIDVDTLLDLRPRQFRSLSPVEDSDETFTGFIAEEADELGLTPWVGYDEEGRPDSFSYPSWVAALQKIARHQRDQLATQADQIAALSARLDALEDRAA